MYFLILNKIFQNQIFVNPIERCFVVSAFL